MGKTEEEAINRALEQLKLDRDDVSVEILERAKAGFLGLGSCPAKVRVSYGEDEEPAAPAQPKAEKVREDKPKAEKPRTEKKPAEKPQRQRAGGDGLHVRGLLVAAAHDGALAVELFDLCHRRFDGALLVGVGRGGRRLSHFLCCHWFILLFLLLYLKIFCQISLQSRP